MSYTGRLPTIVSHAKSNGFVFPSSDIYDGLAAAYDYGPLGVELRNNLAKLWWYSMVQLHENVVGLDAAIFMAPRVWEASGHLAAFNDPLIDNRVSKKRYRADQLIEEAIEKLWKKATKDADKKAKKEGWDPGGEAYRNYLHKSRHGQKAVLLQERLEAALQGPDLDRLREIIIEENITDPESGTADWTDVRQFNLMFSTQMAQAADEEAKLYLRPETAQGAYVNFLNVQRSMRLSLPFGIAQIGKSFRNEIIARQFIFRMREFSQMELQFFVKPGDQQRWYDYWRAGRLAWHRSLGLDGDVLRTHEHVKLAHYAEAAEDIEFNFPFGFRELEGIHSRTDFDLNRHEEYSGKKLRFYDANAEESYIPYVVETAVGLDRLVLAHLCNAYAEEEAPTADGGTETRVVLKLHPLIAPVKAAILPLVKKDGLPEKAREVFDELRWDFLCEYDEKDTIGRRYRRQDQRGTPYCITIDQDTLSDGLVTIRDRDTMEQERVPMAELRDRLRQKLDIRRALDYSPRVDG